MERTGGLRLQRLPTEVSQAPRVENLRGSSRGSQVRSESNHSWAHDFRDPVRGASRREDLKLFRNTAKDQLHVTREVAHQSTHREVLPATGKDEVSLKPLVDPRNLEEFVQQDLDTFWRWCPTPVDGLHRCGLLVKLFDYCGLTRKENKAGDKVRRLNSELHALGVFTTDQVEPHQRVPYEAFVQSRRLREAVQNCSDAKRSWERKRKGCRPAAGQTPLALWVLNVISFENKG
ncbi:unnamed protein product [Durusdinium trenchii]|uniref:Uncharacterized protein n=1 Tax=Durusdinium trenchii TaxID=1381693 RepID=A0ABP0K938_9DINO